jgi:RNA polymerase sigma-70 factor, ECF subfamily
VRRRGRSHPPTRGDEELGTLLGRAASGDLPAQQAFVQRTIDDVWRFCAHLVGVDRADDATQDTYLRALRSLGSYRGDASARAWVIGVARNTCLDLHRCAGRQRRLVERVAQQPYDDVAPRGALAGVDGSADHVRALAPERREAFVLTQVLGFSYEEAAALVGCPVGTIRSRVARARRELLVALDADDAALRCGAG